MTTTKQTTTTKATWTMSRRELAKAVAQHFGWTGRSGGWIYDDKGRPVCHGWDALADRLGSRIVEGQGINWRELGQTLRVH